MGDRWSLSRRELTAWILVVLLVSLGVYAMRSRSPMEEPVRVVQCEPARTLADSPVRLDLNRASEEELQLLPGVGTQRARQIVAFRARHGAFRSIEELVELPGFSRVLVERLAPMLTVTPPESKGP